MLAGIPPAFTFDLDPGAVDLEMQRPFRAAARDVGHQGFLTTTERAEIRNRPVHLDHAQQTFNETRRLPQSHAKENLRRQAGLEDGVAADRSSLAPTRRQTLPCHRGIKPDWQRATALERRVVARPVRRAVD